MWSYTELALSDCRGNHYLLSYDGEPASNQKVLEAMANSESFRNTFIDLMSAIPFTAFRWETPGLGVKGIGDVFEFVVLDAPDLIAPADKQTFAQLFAAMDGNQVGAFPNLGGDAMMIIPRPLSANDSYSHIGDFVQHAPKSQQHALWELTAQTMLRELEEKPRWLNTAGGGVNWLHVRIDHRPKYYHYRAYCG